MASSVAAIVAMGGDRSHEIMEEILPEFSAGARFGTDSEDNVLHDDGRVLFRNDPVDCHQ